jgi:cyclic pyranopterin phosphate synthase
MDTSSNRFSGKAGAPRPPGKGTDVNARLQDRFGRRISYLRLSITDRCNLRCNYCHPKDNTRPREEILSFEEIYRVIKIAVSMGITKVRITGGEPLVRKDAMRLVNMLAGIPGIEDLTLSTNAVLLAKHARQLARAGLQRVNISLDTLRPERFKKFTGGELAPVLEGIEAACRSGLTPVRLNTVAMRGFNEDEIPDIIDYAVQRSLTLRFIEFMPMGNGLDWNSHYITVDELLKMPGVRERVDVTTAPDRSLQTAAAFYLPLKSGKGDVGFIAPMSQRFCHGCNRLRLTADGRLRSCLPSDVEVNMRPALREKADDEAISALIRKAVLLKPEFGEYRFNKGCRGGNTVPKRSMTEIGG